MTKKDADILCGTAVLLMLFSQLFAGLDRFEFYGLSGLIRDAETTVMLAGMVDVRTAILALVAGMQLIGHFHGQTDLTGIRPYYDVLVRRHASLTVDLGFVLAVFVVISHVIPVYYSVSATWGSTASSLLGLGTNALGIAGLLNISWLDEGWSFLTTLLLIAYLFPLIYHGKRYVGNAVAIVLGVLVLPVLLNVNPEADGVWHYMPLVLGCMLLGEYDVPGVLQRWIGKSALRWLAVMAMLAIAGIAAVLVGNLEKITLAVKVIVMLLGVHLLVAHIPVVSAVLGLIGRNALYCCLVSGFIGGTAYGEKLYMLRNIWLVYAAMLAVILAVALVLRLIRCYAVTPLLAKLGSWLRHRAAPLLRMPKTTEE